MRLYDTARREVVSFRPPKRVRAHICMAPATRKERGR